MIANYMREVEDSKFTREEMIDDVLHLFLAGKDTTSSVITLASYYLCAYP
jgi:cytochrome P450